MVCMLGIQIMSGKKNLKTGPLSEETKQKISNANKGKKRTIETRNKMSVAKKLYWKNISEKKSN